MAQEAALIGGRMRERREELDLSQREVAEKLPGSAQGTDVSRWERGLHRPNSDTLGHIADALQTTVADLHAGPEADREEQGPAPDPFATDEPAWVARLEAKLDALLEGQVAVAAEATKQRARDAAREAEKPDKQRKRTRSPRRQAG